ncbi:cytochrome P450 [Jeotgalibacillus haloalkalitolerans]|uniref:Cytochrome P450 n=1 Tax=Jeotgalibacillus haloalkalitolerans TaxID=3104292 RepID=A0ABU5KQD4_9BACL|nr:cytochrome P450 [Jeotgalibacillus sp. HH7-29]MDZ5713466.1 cytochrome P450 [Jeotgalibacillus sp. HH7-29]
MDVRKPVPRAKGIDNSLSLIKEGFTFLPNQRKKLGSDIFETRLLGKKAICMAGEEASELFYDTEKFKREDAMPKPLKMSLFGDGSLHGMDGEAHRNRKRTFLSMFTPDRVEDLKRLALEHLDARVSQWEKEDTVYLFDEMQEILARAGCEWAGVPLEDGEVKQRTGEMIDMIDSFGGSLSRFKDGKKARDSHEEWLQKIIKGVRKGKMSPPPNSAAYIMAHHRETDGKRFDKGTAAVELSNSFRPLLATAYFLTFGVLAMHEHPESVEKLKHQPKYSHLFAQETRRYYPFVPAMAAKVKKNFTFKGYKFKKDTLVVLDIFGTNRHPDSWESPDSFIPERFEGWKGSPFSFIPQGGGDHHTGHRCAGEWLTVIVMSAFFEFFAKNLTYDLPEQDLSFSMERMPTFPNSRLIIQHVKKTADYDKNLKELLDGFSAVR